MVNATFISSAAFLIVMNGHWLDLDWAWQLRGMVNRLWGGVGMRRGGVIRRTFEWVMPWTFGAWKWFNRDTGFGCGRK